MTFEESARARCPKMDVRRSVALAAYTTLRVGGPADYFVEPENETALLAALAAARDAGLPVLLMGNGSNLLVRDGGFSGVAIRLNRAFSQIEEIEGGLYAKGGALLSVLSRTAAEKGLTGLEFAQGIPGTVGGASYMNAGAYGGEMGQVVSSLRIFDGEKTREIPGEQMEFSYRHTRAMEEGWVVLGASFRLRAGDPLKIEELMRDYAARRREKQPLEYPSAGSFFKRPAGHFAGALIEGAGLKGLTEGRAQVSEKHAGFLINLGGATADDFLRLMARVQAAVMERFGVRLENEVRIVGNEK